MVVELVKSVLTLSMHKVQVITVDLSLIASINSHQIHIKEFNVYIASVSLANQLGSNRFLCRGSMFYLSMKYSCNIVICLC